jgi:acyl-CoA synthetase (AMP-forming)/AMP-acid ligase II
VTLGADLSGIFDTVAGRATLGDQIRRHARNQPDHLAIAHFDKAGTCLERLTYRELNQRTNRLAQSLRDLGIRRGDVVAIMSPNSLDYAVMYVAAAKLGAVTTGINCNFHDAEIQFQIQHSEPVAIMVDTSVASRVDDKRAALPTIRHYISSGAGPGGNSSTPGTEWVAVSSLYADSVDDSEPHSDVKERDPLFMIYTSGTEAFPKAVLIPHRNYSIATLPGWAVGAPSQDDVLTGGIIQAHDRWLHLTPLHTIAGLGNLTITLSTGASVIMPTTPDPKLCLSLIERERHCGRADTDLLPRVRQDPGVRERRPELHRAGADVRRDHAAVHDRRLELEVGQAQVGDVLGAVRADAARHDRLVPHPR